MKAIVGALVFAVLAALTPTSAPDVRVVILGDFRGQLSPCGCTTPMTGGVRRMATAVRSIGAPRIVVGNGALAGGIGVQNEMKAQTLAQTLKAMDVAAYNPSVDDDPLGAGVLDGLQPLCGGVILRGEIRRKTVSGIEIVGLRKGEPAPKVGPGSIVLFDGRIDDARAIAKTAQPALLVYRSTEPEAAPIRVGRTWLVSPGEDGKAIVTVKLHAGGASDYRVTKLDPGIADDATVSRFYATYLRRVDQANLIDRLPRPDTGDFVGSANCALCHATAADVWSASGHARAFDTLAKQGHGKDPDCVGCHVVGLTSPKGFQSKSSTPHLAAVGCESCHGPGRAHSQSPATAPMPKLGERACAPCHVPNHSPRFDFKTYWSKISH